MKPSDWNLLVLSAAGGSTLSPVQLQKALFILSRCLSPPPTPFYVFEPYDYGAFCKDVYTDAAALHAQGDAMIFPGYYRSYAATRDGIEKAQRLRASLPPSTAEYIDTVVSWVRSLSFSELVTAMYEAFPDTKVNSVFQYKQ